MDILLQQDDLDFQNFIQTLVLEDFKGVVSRIAMCMWNVEWDYRGPKPRKIALSIHIGLQESIDVWTILHALLDDASYLDLS